ncbi:hypothetical protein SAMN06297382_0921 [Amphiplicatus metriothermophilus]|uniref:Uncharacterized protein n=2 Tax=Amphiplicatus metriothermophilus TaxID=1519374 RepID=A0A239PM32_9PROT|nr:hypothetical protein SAMN06297382_0921 [Amphiplicatus metriothermophilus]
MKPLMAGEILICVLLTGSALAQEPPMEKAIEEVLACIAIASDEQRLACLDAAAARLARAKAEAVQQKTADAAFSRSDIAPENNEAGAPREVVGTVTQSIEEFGAESVHELRAEKKKESLREITAAATSIHLNSRRRATIYLQNGQVWRQLDSDSAFHGHVTPNRSYVVTIKRAALGSYIAKVEGFSRPIRVKRIK